VAGEHATNANDPVYFQDVQRKLVDVSLRIEEMDRCGIAMMVISLNQPGVQAIPQAKAIQTARRVNDELAERFVGAHPTPFAGFAAIALQDVTADDELESAVTQLGFKGALINGYSNIGGRDAVQYLDEKPVWEILGARCGVERPRVPAFTRTAGAADVRRLSSTGRQEKSMTHYLRENFHLTTRGAFRTAGFLHTLLEVGADHILFTVD